MTLTITVTADIAACRALRRTVFIEEQGVSEADEVDDLDDQAVHILAVQDGMPVGSARLLTLGDTGKIGRVCVLRTERGTGLGAALMQAAVAQFRATAGIKQVKLGSQLHALTFYTRLGFVPYGDVYWDAGIEHRDMVLDF